MAANDGTHDGELTPQQEADVRRLLADARHTEPTPDAVVARLDRVLADLAGEPARSARVVRLADRRRRVGAILVAAAASVVAVIGIGQVITNTGSGGDAETADSADAVPESGAEAPEAQAGGSRRNELSGDGLAYDRRQRTRPYLLRAEDFARDADALQLEALPSAMDEDTGSELPDFVGGALARVRDRAVCNPGSWGRGSYLAVLYDGAEGWVVLRQPQGDTQVADLFLCGGEAVVRSVTLQYP